MSKAAQIRKLYAQGKGTSEIAGIVGCLPEYVRVVRQRDALGGKSVADIRYDANNPDYARRRSKTGLRYRLDPVFREQHKAGCRARYLRKKRTAQGQKQQAAPAG